MSHDIEPHIVHGDHFHIEHSVPKDRSLVLSSCHSFLHFLLSSDHNVAICVSVSWDILLKSHVQAIAFGEDTEKGELKRGTGVGVGVLQYIRSIEKISW